MFFFFFNDTATTEIYTLSLHDALPIFPVAPVTGRANIEAMIRAVIASWSETRWEIRSEEHTSELQSRSDLVCRLLLEKKKTGTVHRTLAAGSAVTPRRSRVAAGVIYYR